MPPIISDVCSHGTLIIRGAGLFNWYFLIPISIPRVNVLIIINNPIKKINNIKAALNDISMLNQNSNRQTSIHVFALLHDGPLIHVV